MGSITVLDGGMGKELRRIGAPFRQPEWSALTLLEAPEMVRRAHQNFVDAGAEVIITNNYAVVPYHLGAECFDERGAELIELSGRLARAVADGADGRVRVAGSLPPLFGSYEPDRFDDERAGPLYRTIAVGLEPHVDLWVGETLSTIAELHSVIDAVRAVGSELPVWISFTLPDVWPTDGITLRSGETPADIANAVASQPGDIEAVLINCSLPEQTGPALRTLSAALGEAGARVRIGGYANAFPVTRSGIYQANEVVFERRPELTPDHYADVVATWIDDGATIVGGCCDMYPEHIAALVHRFGARPANRGVGGEG